MRLHRDVKRDRVKRTALFAALTGAQITEITAAADEIDLRPGTALTRQHDIGREFIVILDGEADVYRGEHHVARLGDGDWFGEVALLTGTPRNATVVARTRVHALVIPGHRFLQILEHVPAVRARIEEELLERTA